MLIPELQKIVCAAIRHARTGLVITGARHFDEVMCKVIEALPKVSISDWADSDQGFIDQWGNFLDRQEAYKIALAKDQYKPYEPYTPGVLYSEDLY